MQIKSKPAFIAFGRSLLIIVLTYNKHFILSVNKISQGLGDAILFKRLFMIFSFQKLNVFFCDKYRKLNCYCISS